MPPRRFFLTCGRTCALARRSSLRLASGMQRFELGEFNERAFFLGAFVVDLLQRSFLCGAFVDACFDKPIRHFTMGTSGSIRGAARMQRNRKTERFRRGT
ncbi:MAG: hypothetical protein IPM54_10795 [Polyangiaceae bacterium]|nr:hypothetical protein [Polyangiaceae bacterium]